MTPEYQAFLNAKNRCTNPRSENYMRYGKRGIRFLFPNFERFLSEVGARPTPQHSLDRIDNDGHYAPSNIRWATRSEQQRNRRPRLNKASRYHGVYWAPRMGRWRVQITFKRLQAHIGYFTDEHDAARAANFAARMFHGPSAKQNIIPDSSARGRAARSRKAAMMACMLLLVATLAHAGERAIDVQPFSRLPHAEALLKECSPIVEQTRAIVSSLPERVDWKIIVVCDEISWLWEALEAGVYSQTITAWTDVRRTGPRPGFTTYIRGLCFREHLKGGPEHTLAHELGHIMTNSAVESDADEWAKKALAAHSSAVK